MPQPSDLAAVEHRLGALPDGELGKLKSTMPGLRRPAHVEHRLGAHEVDGQRLFDEHRLAAIERAKRDLGLQLGRRGDRHRVDRRIIDEHPPIAEPARHVRGARQLGGPRGIGAGERDDLAARIGAERRQENGSAVVAADDADTDHQ